MKLRLDQLADIVDSTHDEYGNLEVVFVGDDENGQYMQTHLDVVVCNVTGPDGSERQVFALMVKPDDKLQARRTLMQ